MNRRLRAACLALVLLASGLALSPTAPATSVEDGCVGYADTVRMAAFTVPAGTVQVFSEPTAIQAGTVHVAGSLLTRDGAGDDAPALCIEAETVVVSALGVICTGSGQDGTAAMDATEALAGDGTKGGDLTLILQDNPATLAAPSLNVLGLICTGDGGDGGAAIIEACLPAALGIQDAVIPTCPEGNDPEPCDALPHGACPAEPCVPPVPTGDTPLPACEDAPCVGCVEPCDALPAGACEPCVECVQPCDALPEGSCEPCLPAAVGDTVVPTCEEDPCEGCIEPPNICDVPIMRRATGGAAGDAGVLALHAAPGVLALAPASLKVGAGGDGGDASTFGGLRGSNEAYGGAAGASYLTLNDASPTGVLAAIGASQGGDGGDALAVPSPECGGNDPCQDAMWENRTYCLVRDALAEACFKTPHIENVCDPANALVRDLVGKPLYGAHGNDDTDAPTGPDAANPGYSGEDASNGATWQVDCGFGVTTKPPYGKAGCGASAACGSGTHARPGFYGEPGYSGAAAIATATNGTFGVLMGGNGGTATATGANGGMGGEGGKGGKGAVGCFQEHNGAPGGRGGSGGAGGMATADAGRGGNSEIQGGKGGDVQANPGAGGAGGMGGEGGDPADRCEPYTGLCDTEEAVLHSWGGYWGCGGVGGGRAGFSRFPGMGGTAGITGGHGKGPDGAELPGTIPPPYGANGKAAARYLSNPACPV